LVAQVRLGPDVSLPEATKLTSTPPEQGDDSFADEESDKVPVYEGSTDSSLVCNDIKLKPREVSQINTQFSVTLINCHSHLRFGMSVLFPQEFQLQWT